MAKQDVIVFWNKVNEDKGLQRKLKAEVQRGSDWKAIVQFASKNGFNFSTEDYGEAVSALPRALGADGYKAWKRGEELDVELTREDMEQVVGGQTSTTFSSLVKEGSVLRFDNPLRSILRPFSGMAP